MGVEDLGDRPALGLRRREAFLVIERIDRQRLAGFGAGDKVVEIAAGVTGPDLFDDHRWRSCLRLSVNVGRRASCAILHHLSRLTRRARGASTLGIGAPERKRSDAENLGSLLCGGPADGLRPPARNIAGRVTDRLPATTTARHRAITDRRPARPIAARCAARRRAPPPARCSAVYQTAGPARARPRRPDRRARRRLEAPLARLTIAANGRTA